MYCKFRQYFIYNVSPVHHNNRGFAEWLMEQRKLGVGKFGDKCSANAF